MDILKPKVKIQRIKTDDEELKNKSAMVLNIIFEETSYNKEKNNAEGLN